MLLRECTDIDIIQRGINFWYQVLESSPMPEALPGFGVWSAVTKLDQNKWEDLTLRTCKITNGKLEWPWQISKRIKSSESITDIGLKIMTIMVQADLDGFDLDQVRDDAQVILAKSKNRTDIRKSWENLRDEMMQRGRFDVGNL